MAFARTCSAFQESWEIQNPCGSDNVAPIERLRSAAVQWRNEPLQLLPTRFWDLVPMCYTDASNTGGAVVMYTAKHCIVSTWSWSGTEFEQQSINVKEIWAIQAAMSLTGKIFSPNHKDDFSVHIVSDSMVAIQTIRRGWSKNYFSNEAIRAIHSSGLQFCLSWIEGSTNPADGPSRGKPLLEHLPVPQIVPFLENWYRAVPRKLDVQSRDDDGDLYRLRH